MRNAKKNACKGNLCFKRPYDRRPSQYDYRHFALKIKLESN